jgi:hypothetical protein
VRHAYDDILALYGVSWSRDGTLTPDPGSDAADSASEGV